jgi:hypothetical protein
MYEDVGPCSKRNNMIDELRRKKSEWVLESLTQHIMLCCSLLLRCGDLAFGILSPSRANV